MAQQANIQNAEHSAYSPLPVWARKTQLPALTGVPDKFAYQFAVDHPNDVRKFGGGGRNGTLVFRVAAVLAAIENGGAKA